MKYGKNKDGEHLPQINLTILFGEDSGLPFYYRKLAENIPDIKTIRELIRELDVLRYQKVKLAMDRGFCSKESLCCTEALSHTGCCRKGFLESGKSPIQGEVMMKQEQLYRDLGVKPLLAHPDQK